jgi:hypothetical protein
MNQIRQLAAAVRADAAHLIKQAEALEHALTLLEDADATAAWCATTIRDGIDRCLIAATDLTRAADDLDAHAAVTVPLRPQPVPT